MGVSLCLGNGLRLLCQDGHVAVKWQGWSRLSAEGTHNHPEGIKGAMATADAIFMCRYYFGGYHGDYEEPINDNPTVKLYDVG